MVEAKQAVEAKRGDPDHAARVPARFAPNLPVAGAPALHDRLPRHGRIIDWPVGNMATPGPLALD